MTHPKGLRLANETYASVGAQKIVSMKTREELMQNLVQGCEEQALMDEIAVLKAENERLRAALKPFSDEASWWFSKGYNASEPVVEGFGDYQGVMTCGDLFKARAALKGGAA